MGGEIDEWRREALARAATCREQAAATNDVLMQRTWLRLAVQYEQLAATVGEEIADRPRKPGCCR